MKAHVKSVAVTDLATELTNLMSVLLNREDAAVHTVYNGFCLATGISNNSYGALMLLSEINRRFFELSKILEESEDDLIDNAAQATIQNAIGVLHSCLLPENYGRPWKDFSQNQDLILASLLLSYMQELLGCIKPLGKWTRLS